MKRYIAYFICGLLPFLWACEDEFLTQKPDDKLTSDAFYRNQADAEAALATVYAQIGAADRWNVTEVNFVVEHFRSDMCMPGPDRYADWTAISTFSNTEGNSRSTIYWQDAYRGIFHANQVIEKVGAMNEEKIKKDERDRIVAEAKFLRGLLHFRLLNNWEKIILQDKAPAGEADLSKPLSERDDVWKLIEQDFNDAISVLPEQYIKSKQGRATKGAAIGFLGKALLYQGKFGDAAEQLEKLVVDKIGNYDLVNNFKSNFDGSNENNKESVFEIQYSSVRSNGRHIGHVSAKFTSAPEIGGWGNIEATQNMVDEFKAEGQVASTGKYDTRLYETLFFNDTDVDIFGQSYSYVFGAESNRAIFRKYTLSDIPEEDNSAWYSSQNIPLLRFSDVLLMYAEAINETETADAAKPFIDRVRARAHMPVLSAGLSKEQMRNRIMHERAVELAYEGHRFFDLRRWGMDLLENKMKNSGKPGAENFSSTDKAYFPIPESETNSNSAL
ncbi:RagB/SusD family nutrient uptake outer membrane protein [Saccharicrinis sp. GN24d3]|uniref:RagB/SusD family nutrient uptake outer membrane protein n=1 Tax=Saccharicrinis sp. GN24d3 TaxID=3458416 RepID=UPI004035BF5A